MSLCIFLSEMVNLLNISEIYEDKNKHTYIKVRYNEKKITHYNEILRFKVQ